MKGRPQVLLTYARPWYVTGAFHDSILELATATHELPFGVGILGHQSGVLIARARNALVDAFLERPEFSHMLMVDTDVQFRPDHITQLLEADKPIISGVTTSMDSDGTVWPVVLDYNKDEDRFERISFKKLMGDKPIRVGAVGCSFVLMERRVLEALGVGPLWPYAEQIRNERPQGEDVTFCVRAREKGFYTWAHPKVLVGHQKMVILDGGPPKDMKNAD